MSVLNIPSSIAAIYTKLSNDVKSLINKSNPFKNKSLTKAMLAAFAGRAWDVYKQIEAFVDECFDDTRDVTLERECADYGIIKKTAEVAKGNISITGTAGETVPKDKKYYINSLAYIVDANTNITAKSLAVTIAYDDGIVTVTFLVAHNLGTSQKIIMSGCSNPNLNGSDLEVRVTGALTLEYDADIAGTGTDSGTCAYNNAVCAVTSEGFGEDYNRNAGEILTVETTIDNIDDDAVVVYEGITGGLDEEEKETLRGRLQQRKKNPAAYFNEAEVETLFLNFSWVKRVFIKRCTPLKGEATIYLVKEDNGIPSAGEIQDAKDYFEEYLPIDKDYDLIHVEAPVALSEPFVFTALSPDTSTMRTAIEANLEALFVEQSEVGVTISEDVYRGVIANTIDPQSLQKVTSFTLTSPSGDIDPDDDELPIYGGTTWSIAP